MEAEQTEIPALSHSDELLHPLSRDGEPASILVVDDNENKLASIAAVVASMGLNVLTARSGREALRQLLKRDFAVVLLDVYMPIMDGFETAILIHNRPRSAHTPIIFVTAEAGSEIERSRGYTLGAVDYIYSPIVPDVLRAKIGVFVDLFYLNRQLKRQSEELQLHTEEIARKNLQLEDATKMKSEFLANMSHELRTPLNAIIGFSEVLKDGLGGELTKKQGDYVTEIFKSGMHLLSLINDILDLSKVEAGRMALELEAVDVAGVLEAGFSIIKEKALQHRIRLKLDVPDHAGDIGADARKVKQIVYNLLSNAVKFTPEGGEVRVSARAVKRGEMRLVAPQGGGCHQLPLPQSEYEDFLEIRVCDNGIGIDRADLPRLFQAFLQLDSSLARQHDGTGLGLAMVRRLTELHGGTVGVASAPGCGSCFAVWLPWRKTLEEARQAEPSGLTSMAAEAAETTAVKGALTRRALVIEDDELAATALRAHLEGAGFRVDWAPDAVRGLEMAAQERPDLITLDLLLPGMGGWEALSRIKKSALLSGIPVVIVSIVADKKTGFALGAAKVLQKPVARKTLLYAIGELGFGVGIGGQSGRKFSVLVVDDDRKAVELIAAHLEKQNCEVFRAHGGREAIASARRLLPDLIILDLVMPDISGFDVVEALKSRPDTAAVPILILTGKTITKADQQRLNGDVLKIVGKAYLDRPQFLAEVQRALHGKCSVLTGENHVADTDCRRLAHQHDAGGGGSRERGTCLAPSREGGRSDSDRPS
ncbi:response regulator [Ramlibacter sp. 2FC]|uniref:response regulator n=1 Tax=Ramlibacter sp. 2FC TaxID=2502188 RepID=UPI0010F987B3|nr:response regulator [Ramlibacter sp. 2FC]